jgi:hypothetical protein
MDKKRKEADDNYYKTSSGNPSQELRKMIRAKTVIFLQELRV